ncbi:hypothetical protein NKJ16_29710 [Mesorhizobium sp. M0179]|uniref:hypothetical protein n=1 Tax=Mesorhizobium sp. M0179 TaxID=2956905 RepID=UPI00333BAA5D
MTLGVDSAKRHQMLVHDAGWRLLQEPLGLTWKPAPDLDCRYARVSRSTAATAATIDLSRCEHADLGGGHSVRLKRSAHLIRHQTGLRNLDFQACSWVCTVSALTAGQVPTPLEAIVSISRAIPAPTAGV